jgi:hypothetical protein
MGHGDHPRFSDREGSGLPRQTARAHSRTAEVKINPTSSEHPMCQRTVWRSFLQFGIPSQNGGEALDLYIWVLECFPVARS